jgi:GNAT superfamily N-acetyltransferase
MDELALLAVDLDASFVMSTSGRIARVNSPDGEPAPRAVLAGCGSGNLVRVRHDVGEPTARDIIALVGSEPPWSDPASPPGCLAALVSLLSREAPVEKVTRGIIYRLPRGLQRPAEIQIVSGEEAEGRRWLERLAREGTPQVLQDAGFKSVGDFWAPWCVALEGGEIAATAFAARLGRVGAEVGVYTFPGYRGRGFAAAVTTHWSSLAELADRRLFYSTQTTNLSSQRVAERLGLARLGASLSIM